MLLFSEGKNEIQKERMVLREMENEQGNGNERERGLSEWNCWCGVVADVFIFNVQCTHFLNVDGTHFSKYLYLFAELAKASIYSLIIIFLT